MEWILYAILAFVLFTFLGYNRLIRLRTNTYKAFDSLDKLVEKRNDMIDELVMHMQKSMKNESSKLNELSELYNKDKSEDLTLTGRLLLTNKINRVLSELVAAAEDYPELKNNKEFSRQLNLLASIEEQLNGSAKAYNESVRFYNNAIHMFPSNVFALLFGFRALPSYSL